jgi:hypothetical protein
MEVGQGPNVGCSAKGGKKRKLNINIFIYIHININIKQQCSLLFYDR